MAEVDIKDAVKIYKEYAAFSTIVAARINSTSNHRSISIYSQWTQDDVVRMQRTKFGRTDILQKNEEEYENIGLGDPHETNDILWCKGSPCGRFRALVRDVTIGNATKQFIEVWNNFCKLLTVNLEEVGQHGRVYSKDGVLDCFDWSPSSEKLLYLAEKKTPQPVSFFAKPRDREDGGVLGDVNVYRDHWGEAMTDKSHPVLCILDVETADIQVVHVVPDDVSPGRGYWCPDDYNIVFVGWKHEPYRLGLLYQERECDLYCLSIKTGICRIINKPNVCIRSPSLSPDFAKISFLQHDTGAPLSSSNHLVVHNFRTGKTSIVIDIIHKTRKSDDFQGLFASWPLPERCWAVDNRRFVFHSSWRSKRELYVVNTEDKKVSRITNDPRIGAWHLADVYYDIVLATYSSPNIPHRLVFGLLPPDGKESTIVWHTVDPNASEINEISWRIIKHQVLPEHVDDRYEHLDYESILLEPAGALRHGRPLPLVLYPHGGPHMVFPAHFVVFMSALCRCGFAVQLVNYRGSIGFGQDNITCFLGNMGKFDVPDVYNAAKHLIDTGIVDRNRVCLMGGSYGGTIGAFMISKYPNFAKAAAFRNAVYNLAAGISGSDMTDWFYLENGLPYEIGHVATDEEIALFYKKSPIRDASKVTTPVLLLVGADEQRVPPTQAQEYYKALKANKCKTKMLLFKDAHPLSKMETKADLFMNVFNWYKEHIK